MRKFIPVLILSIALSGCAVRTIANVATAPVRVVGKTVDLATTSQAEADQNRGKKLRRLEERYGKLERDYGKENRRCEAGSEEACTKRDAILTEMEEIRPQLPARAD